MPLLYSETLKRLSRPLSPIPTSEHPRFPHLEDVRAVLFDVYGTLFISGSGEVGTSCQSACQSAFAEAFAAADIAVAVPPDEGVRFLQDRIEHLHAEARRQGEEYPEVDIVEVWRFVVEQFIAAGKIPTEAARRADLKLLAVEYEARANPVWPMPGLSDCLRQLRSRRFVMGIVSNAQFYTRELFPALLGHRAEAWGFDPALQFYSYEHGRAKPGISLYRMAAEQLTLRNIAPAEVLYVGNDMLNDVGPAARVGFRTALFAGDARSLRRRRGDPRVNGVSPEAVLTALSDLRLCFPR